MESCLLREEAKLIRKAHRYTFSTRSFTTFNSINFPEHKVNYIAGRINYLLT